MVVEITDKIVKYVTTDVLLNLFKLIDYERSISAKLTIYRQWAESNPEILAARIICFDNAQLSTTSDVAISIPSQNAKLFPKEPGILNGRSPLPPGIFQGACDASVTVYYPFFFEESRPGGGLFYRHRRLVRRNQKTHDHRRTPGIHHQGPHRRRRDQELSNTTSMLQKTQSTTMKSLAMLAEYRDMETGNHLHRICEYNKQISEKVHEAQPYSFHLSSDYVDDIYLSGMLHDIGKVGVPDSILLKAGSLSVNEWDIMRKHTVWGWDILHQADQELGEQSFLTLASRIALAHHEWYNGNGYPRGLRGENIPLSARISAVSDVYDALTSRRPYKEAWTHDQAVEEILKEKGKQFDPVIVEILENIENDFRRIKHDFPDDGKHSVPMN
jgi:hypothetical protein